MKNKWVFIIVAVLVLAIGGFFGYQYFKNTSQYDLADEAFQDENYEEALVLFRELGNFDDSEARVTEIEKHLAYEEALVLMEAEQYEEAIEIFSELGNFKRSYDKIEEAQKTLQYNAALKLLDEGNYQQAKIDFSQLDGFLDSDDMYELAVTYIVYENAIDLLEEEEIFEAFDIFRTLGDFENTLSYLNECSKTIYAEGVRLMDAGEYLEAETLFLSLGTFEDSAKKAKECDDHQEYAKAVELFEDGERFEAYQIFIGLQDFADAAEFAEQCIAAPSTYVDKFIYSHPDYEWQQVQMQIYTNLQSDEAAFIKIYDGSTLAKAIYFAPGDNYSIGFPNGYYRINIAYGNNWYGEEDMFGPEGSYSSMIFDGGETSYFFYQTYSYSLRLDVGDAGNVNNREISPNSF